MPEKWLAEKIHFKSQQIRTFSILTKLQSVDLYDTVLNVSNYWQIQRLLQINSWYIKTKQMTIIQSIVRKTYTVSKNLGMWYTISWMSSTLIFSKQYTHNNNKQQQKHIPNKKLTTIQFWKSIQGLINKLTISLARDDWRIIKQVINLYQCGKLKIRKSFWRNEHNRRFATFLQVTKLSRPYDPL